MSLETLITFETPIGEKNPFPYRSLNKENFNINYEQGFQSKRELYLHLLTLKESKDFTFSNVLNKALEGNVRYQGKAYAEDYYIFGNKVFLEKDVIPDIRNVLIEQGFQKDFVKNSTDTEYVKSSQQYHELYIKYSDKFLPEAAVAIVDTDDKISSYDLRIMFIGRVDIGNELKPKLTPFLKERKYLPTFRVVRDIMRYPDGPEVRYRDEIIKPDVELGLESFYPWLKTHPKYNTIEQFANAYINSNSPVLLFYGPTGTGKTTFARSLAKILNAVILATSDQHIASDPALFESYKDMLEAARASGDKRPYILLIEDVDRLLFSRISGNREMSRLLNETKGIAPNKDIRVIFTSNITKLDQIDTALLRPGRCFEAVDFRKLSLEEAIEVRKELKYESIDLTHFLQDNMISLAEAIEERTVKEIEIKKYDPKIKPLERLEF